MGSSKGRASRDRKEHRKAAVIRKQTSNPRPRPEPIPPDYIWPSTRPKRPEPFAGDPDGKADVSPFADLRPTSAERTYFNHHLIGAIRGIGCVIMAALALVLVLGVGILVVAKGG